MLFLYALAIAVLAALAYRLASGRLRRRHAPLRCRLRGHQRSGRHVHKIEDAYYSRCRTCGVTMEKPSRMSEWRVVSSMPQARDLDREPGPAIRDALHADPLSTGPTIRRGEPAEGLS